MNHHYNDIRSRIAEPPLWWDENAVPRYDAFSPDETANIYAEECCLLHVECQNCGRPFVVAMSQSSGDRVRRKMMFPQREPRTLADLVRSGDVHYGDPPNVECCPAGPTMNSVPVRVAEFWRKTTHCEWERVTELEIAIDCPWMHEEKVPHV